VNALFSDTSGKIPLELMSLPNHSKGFYSPELQVGIVITAVEM